MIRQRGQRVLDDLKMKALEVLPKNAISRAFGAISELELPPPVQSTVNHGFAKLYDLNVGEAERGPGEYNTLNAFFTRRLKPGARPVEATNESQFVSPVDGKITQFGSIKDETLIQAKGREYGLVELLDSAQEAEHFKRGYYMTIYLSPKDYHRIHSPVRGDLVKMSYIPGHLWPVNPLSVNRVEKLFAINERLVSFLDSEAMGRVAVIKVGATCVGRIGLAYSDTVSNKAYRRREDVELTDAQSMDHAQELAVFNLGSTVIVLVENPDFALSDEIVDGQSVKLGQLLGGVM